MSGSGNSHRERRKELLRRHRADQAHERQQKVSDRHDKNIFQRLHAESIKQSQIIPDFGTPDKLSLWISRSLGVDKSTVDGAIALGKKMKLKGGFYPKTIAQWDALISSHSKAVTTDVTTKRKRTGFEKISTPQWQTHSSAKHKDNHREGIPATDYLGVVMLVGHNIAENTTTTGRLGKRILLKSLEIHSQLQWAGAVDVAYNNTVVINVIYDKRPTGTTPTLIELYTGHLKGLQFMNDDFSGRFKVLKRDTFTLQANRQSGNISDTPISIHRHDFYLPLRGLVKEFRDLGTGAEDDVNIGNIYLVITSRSLTSNNSFLYDWVGRTRYYDTLN